MEGFRNHKILILSILTLVALLSACNLPKPQPTALGTANPTSDQPVIILYPNEGGAGTQVTLTGAGFPENMVLDVHIGIPNAGFSEHSYAKATSDTKGNISLNFSMPGQWPDGAPIRDSKLIVVLSNPNGSVKGLATFNFIPAAETVPASTAGVSGMEVSPTVESASTELAATPTAPAGTEQATSGPQAGTTAVIPLIPQPAENSPQTPLASASANVYRPVPREECAALTDAVGQNLEISGTIAEEPFKDVITNETGTGCQVTITGSGLQFKSFVDIANGLKSMLVNQGWVEDDQYLADGPTGTAAAFRKGSDLALLSVGWTPSPDAACPADQPISACPLKPEQQIYTISLNVARK